MNKQQKINKLRAKWKDCTKCELYKENEAIFFYRGSLDARVVVISDVPDSGINENLERFVYQSGKLFDKLRKRAGLKSGKAFICSLVGCETKKDRNPSLEEFWACKSRLYAMISIVKPKALLLLGGVVLGLLVKGRKEGITKDRGKILNVEFQWKNKLQQYHAIPTFHPAFLLRNRKPELEQLVISDIRKAMELAQDASYIERNDY